MKIALALAFTLAAAACGDNQNAPSDGMMPGDGNNPNPNPTLTSYVVDLVMNHTANPEAPRAYTEFSTLADPDGDANNGSAYSALF